MTTRHSLVAFALLSAPAISLAESSGVDPSGGQLAKLVLGLVIVVGLIVLLSRMLPHLTGIRQLGGGRFHVVSAVSLGTRERAVLLQVGEQQILVGVAPGRINTLHVLDEPLATETPVRSTEPQSWLARTLAGGRR